jgi:hypothetical protein
MARTERWKAGGPLLPILIAVILLLITPASAFTANLISPATIKSGDRISISVSGLSGNDVFGLGIYSSNILNNAAGGFTIPNFPLPFQLNASSLKATGTNVGTLKGFVTSGGAVGEITTLKPGPDITVSYSRLYLYKGDLISFTSTPFTSGVTGVIFTAQGTVAGPSSGAPSPENPAFLNLTVQNVFSGDILVQMYDAVPDTSSAGDAHRKLNVTLSVSTPSSFTGSQTDETPSSWTTGTPPAATLDFMSQANTTLDITPSGSIPAGSSVTVTESKDAPSGSTAPSSSTYRVLGKYMTIDSEALEGKVNSMKITVHYSPEDIPPGVNEQDLRVYYFNPTTNAWEPLEEGRGVDTSSHTVWGIVHHLSVYGILAPVPTPTPAPAPGGQAGGSGNYYPPQVVAAPYKPNVTANITANITATIPVTTAPTMTVAQTAVITAAQTVSPVGTTATPVPVPPLLGILGVILAAGIFVSLKRH